MIADFVHGTDKINLSGIDANTGISGNNAFTWDVAQITNGNHARGHIGFHQEVDAANNWLTIIEGNTASNGASHNLQIALLGQITLDAGDFNL